MGKPHVPPQGHQGAVRQTPAVVIAVLLQGHLTLILLRRQVQNGENPLRSGQGHHQGVELLRDLAHPVGEGADILQKPMRMPPAPSPVSHSTPTAQVMA